jgi:endonuclease YncB( thermonuclease family)
MKLHRFITLLFLCMFVLPVQAASDRPAGVPDEAKWAKVDRVVDGDTVYTKDGTKIRLHGIDTPERDQPYGQASHSCFGWTD